MIYFLPIGDKNTASSRLRVWNIAPHIDGATIGTPEYYTKDDVLIIQKTPQKEELQRAKREGAKVVYDIDDYYWDKVEFHEMLEECDAITVDTDLKKEMIEKFDNLKGKVTVIPDSLDWDGTEKKKTSGNIVGWTGFGNNATYLNGLTLPKEYVLRLVTSSDWVQYIENNKDIQSRPWSLEMVDKYLAECDYGIYVLPEREFEQCKGEHKLLKNWAIGLPTYTSRMPAYVKAMKEAGVGEKYLVDDWSTFKPERVLEKSCREYALKFKAENISNLWEKVIKAV